MIKFIPITRVSNIMRDVVCKNKKICCFKLLSNIVNFTLCLVKSQSSILPYSLKIKFNKPFLRFFDMLY